MYSLKGFVIPLTSIVINLEKLHILYYSRKVYLNVQINDSITKI